MIKLNCRGKIVKGLYSPNGEIILKDDKEGTGGYYIYIYPKDGTKWPGTDKEMVYDIWAEEKSKIQVYFEHYNWVIEWLDEEEK